MGPRNDGVLVSTHVVYRVVDTQDLITVKAVIPNAEAESFLV
jgi:hypothetical protein